MYHYNFSTLNVDFEKLINKLGKKNETQRKIYINAFDISFKNLLALVQLDDICVSFVLHRLLM